MTQRIRETLMRALPHLPPDVTEAVVTVLMGHTLPRLCINLEPSLVSYWVKQILLTVEIGDPRGILETDIACLERELNRKENTPNGRPTS